MALSIIIKSIVSANKLGRRSGYMASGGLLYEKDTITAGDYNLNSLLNFTPNRGAARKGKRIERARLARLNANKRRLSESQNPKQKKDLKKAIKVDKAQLRFGTERQLDLSLPLPPEDDVYFYDKFKKRQHSLDDIIMFHKQAVHPDVLNLPNSLVTATIELNLKMKIKKKKYIENIKSTVCYPHLFKYEVRPRKIVALCKDIADQEAAREAGAHAAGALDIAGLLKSNQLTQRDFDHIVCHTDFINDFAAVKGMKGQPYFPSKQRANFGDNIVELVKYFKNGIDYTLRKDPSEPEYGFIDCHFGTLDMSEEQLRENLKTLFDSINRFKPLNLADNKEFIERVTITTPATQEIFVLKVSDFIDDPKDLESNDKDDKTNDKPKDDDRDNDKSNGKGKCNDISNKKEEQDQKPDDVHMITPTQQMICSTIGALATSLMVTPLDVVKIRLQAQQKSFYKNKCFLYCNGLMEHICYCVNGDGVGHVHGPNNSTMKIDPRDIKWYKRPIPGQFNGTFDALLKIGRSEGIMSLWSGLPPTLLMAIPATVIYFTAYDRLRADLKSWNGTDQQPLWIPVFCGAAARCIAATTISPLEMVRTKMQSKKLSYAEIALAIKQLVRYEGIFSMWRGLGPTLLRDVPFSSIYWASYELMKQELDQRKPTLQFSLGAGAIAGSVAAITTLPFDVAKTHRQIELGERDLIDPAKKIASQNNQYRTSQVLKKIYQQSGVSGLFSGLVPRVIKVAPSCAIMISCYEYGKQFFVTYNKDKTLDLSL